MPTQPSINEIDKVTHDSNVISQHIRDTKNEGDKSPILFQYRTKSSLKNILSLSPASKTPHAKVPPGIYCFVQLKNPNKTLYLLPLKKGASAHMFLAKMLLRLQDVALLSAGELIIGAQNKIIAWCLKSGYYKEILKLNDPALIRKTEMLIQSHFSIQVWERFLGSKWFGNYFDEGGKFHGRNSFKNFSSIEALSLENPFIHLLQILQKELYKTFPTVIENYASVRKISKKHFN